ncbi:MAG: polysaccharide deacetylase family protein [Dethiobacteria bacterium]
MSQKGFWKKYIIVILTVALAILYFFPSNSALPVFSTKRLVPIYYVETGEKKAALSFDACWGANYTPALLEILRKNNIKTTFFLTGFWVEKYPEMVKKIAAEGHEIGNHTYSHPHLSTLSEEEISIELKKVGNMIFDLTKVQPNLFRPPFGEYNNLVITTAKKCGYQSIQWSIDSLDWKEIGKEPMVERVTKNLHPGAIILFHNNGKYTTEALPDIIAFMKKEGYKIVPISELLFEKDYYIDNNTGAQIKKSSQ